MDFKDFRNVHEMLKETVDRCGDSDAYRTILDNGEMPSVSWNAFYDEVRRAGKSLIALGLDKGDKANILSYSNYRWVLTDIALATIGSCSVGIYHSLLPRDVSYIVNHSDAVLVFAEDLEQVAKMLEIRSEVPNIRKVILFKGEAPADDWVITYDEFLELGAEIPEEALEARINDVNADDVATIVYTSGTTGIPKGAVLTHDNLTFTAQSVYHSFESADGDVTLVFLPLAHIFARTCVFTALFMGATAVFARGIETIGEDFKTARPHWFPSVPRVYEKVHTKIISGAQAKGGLALKIFNWAVKVGLRGQRSQGRKKTDPAGARPQIRPRHKARFLQGAGRSRRAGPLVHLGCSTHQPRNRQVLPRRRRADPRRHRHDREHIFHQHQPLRQLPLRLGRPDRSRHRTEDQRRRRDPLSRPQRHARVLQDAGGDRRDAHLRRLAAHR